MPVPLPLTVGCKGHFTRAGPFRNVGVASPKNDNYRPLFSGVRGETVWKIGMSPETGIPNAAKMRLGAPISCLWPPNEHARETCGYFPNSFGRGILRNSLCNGKRFAAPRLRS